MGRRKVRAGGGGQINKPPRVPNKITGSGLSPAKSETLTGTEQPVQVNYLVRNELGTRNGKWSSETTRAVDSPQVHEGELTGGAVTSPGAGVAERNPATEVERCCPLQLRLLRRNEAYSQK